MSFLPTPRDANGHPLHGHGTESVTYRFSGVPYSGNNVFLPIDVKSFMIHVEGATTIAAFSGTASGSTWAYLTSDGISLSDIPVVSDLSGTLFEVASPTSGTTVNVSIFGWR